VTIALSEIQPPAASTVIPIDSESKEVDAEIYEDRLALNVGEFSCQPFRYLT